jgi:hypothetical protein
MKYIFVFVGPLTLLVGGIICLFWPHRVQELALSQYAANPALGKLNPWLGWMKTQSYIVTMRIGGAVAILVALFMVTLIIRGLLHRYS